MNDQILLDNYLLILKSTVEVYVHGTLESTNNKVRTILKDCLNDTLTMQSEAYDKMASLGWYKTSCVSTNTIVQTLNKINSNK